MPRRYKIALGGAVALALALRLLLAAAQLPHHYQADEFQVVERALAVGAGKLNPGLFTWPGTLVIYANFLAFAAAFAVMKTAGAVAGAAAFADLYWHTPGPFYFLSRAISALAGVAALGAAALWAYKSLGRTAAVVAAYFVALAPAAAAASALTLPDMGAVALGAAALAVAVTFIKTAKIKYALAAGLLLGLGAAAKYHVLLYAPALAACVIVSSATAAERLRALAAGAAAAAGGFVLACPFAVWDAPSFIRDLTVMAHRPGMLRWAPAPTYLLGTTLPMTLGWPLIVMALAGVATFPKSRLRYLLIAALAAAPFVIFAFVRPLPPRHLLPLVPPAALAAGALGEAIARARRRTLYRAASFALVALFAGALLLELRYIGWRWREDTRTAAAAFIEENVPAHAAVIVESVSPDVLGPPLWPEKSSLARLSRFYRRAGGGSPGRLGLLRKNPSYPFGHRTYDIHVVAEVADYDDLPRPSYAIITEPDDRDYFAEQAKPYGTPLSTWGERYGRYLRENGRLLKVFAGAGRPGPTVKLYYLR